MLVSIFFICLVTYAKAKVCESNQFWSSILERCENCSRCVHPDIVIRPCQGYTDTVCGPLSELNIDWTWLRNQGALSKVEKHSKNGKMQKEMLETFKENFSEIKQHEKHVKEKQKHLKHKHNFDYDENSEERLALPESHYKFTNHERSQGHWSKPKFKSKQHRTLEEKVSDDVTTMDGNSRNNLREPLVELKTLQNLLKAHSDFRGIDQLHFNDNEAFELLKSSRKAEKKENETYDPSHLKFDKNGLLIKNFGFTKVEDNVKMEKLVDDSKFAGEFSTTEKFILDWQTVILGVAVFSCIVFFLVAGIYSMQHAKRWKKLKSYFDSDVEELQSRLFRRISTNEISPSGIYKTTTEVVHVDKGQCKYLERIIRMNQKKKVNFVRGNIYEKDSKLVSELKPLTKKYPTVHQFIGEKI